MIHRSNSNPCGTFKTMGRLDSMYMAAIRAHLKCQTRFSKGQVAGVGLAYIALNLLPVEIIEVDVDEIFRRTGTIHRFHR